MLTIEKIFCPTDLQAPHDEALRYALAFARGGSLEELLFGSTAEKVLRATPLPVVCVPPN